MWEIKRYSLVSSLQLPEDFEVVYSQVQGEIVVGGVFLRLFIAQPTWVSCVYDDVMGNTMHSKLM